MKVFGWFLVLTTPLFVLVAIVEIGAGMYLGEDGRQALGLIHFFLNLMFFCVGVSIIKL